MSSSGTSSGGGVLVSNAGLISALAYSLFSMTITLTNKALLTSYSFDSTLTLTFLQGLVTVLCAFGRRCELRRCRLHRHQKSRRQLPLMHPRTL